MASINNLTATTELEAVNAMLSSIGEAPVTAVDGNTLTDVVMAVNILRAAARDVQRRPWRFNTEFGVEIAPAGTVNWLVFGETVALNYFTPPAGLVSFTPSASPNQQGACYTDMVIRPAKLVPSSPLVFYDRTLNRDGWETDYLYIDPVWMFDFEKLPQSAREYIVVKAMRQFAQRVGGNAEAAGFTAQDEAMSLMALKEEHGDADDHNIFDNASVFAKFGGRPLGPSGYVDGRYSPGSR